MSGAAGGLLVLLAFLSGAIPFGVLAGRLRGIDVRRVGSGNIGATNVGRALGARWALAVLLLDAAKGALPTGLALRFLSSDAAAWAVPSSMVAAVAGHVFSPFLRFRGGKGVATGLGVVSVVSPLAALAGLGAYALTFALARVSALGSLAGVVTALATLSCTGAPLGFKLAVGAIASLIVARHAENLRQLWARRRRARGGP